MWCLEGLKSNLKEPSALASAWALLTDDPTAVYSLPVCCLLQPAVRPIRYSARGMWPAQFPYSHRVAYNAPTASIQNQRGHLLPTRVMLIVYVIYIYIFLKVIQRNSILSLQNLIENPLWYFYSWHCFLKKRNNLLELIHAEDLCVCFHSLHCIPLHWLPIIVSRPFIKRYKYFWCYSQKSHLPIWLPPRLLFYKSRLNWVHQLQNLLDAKPQVCFLINKSLLKFSLFKNKTFISIHLCCCAP